MTQYDFTPYPIDEIIARSAYVTTRAIEELAALRESVAALTAQNAEQTRQLSAAIEALQDIVNCAQLAAGEFVISGALYDQTVLTLQSIEAPAPQEQGE